MSAGGEPEGKQEGGGGAGGAAGAGGLAAGLLRAHWSLGLRALHLVVALLAVALAAGALESPQVVRSDFRHVALIFAAYSSVVVVAGVLLGARLLGGAAPAAWRAELAFSAVLAVLCAAAAGVTFYDWHRSYYANVRPNKQLYDLLLASGVFAVAAAALLAAHAAATLRARD